MMYENKIEDQNKDWSFYCPVCKELLFELFHVPYVCGCGTRWKISPPINIDTGDKSIAEMKGVPVKY